MIVKDLHCRSSCLSRVLSPHHLEKKRDGRSGWAASYFDFFRGTALLQTAHTVADIVLDRLCSGCEAYVVREGWEGLVRGNQDATAHVETPATSPPLAGAPTAIDPETSKKKRGGFVATYGEGELLKEGEGEQTLRGRYIIRVSPRVSLQHSELC